MKDSRNVVGRFGWCIGTFLSMILSSDPHGAMAATLMRAPGEPAEVRDGRLLVLLCVLLLVTMLRTGSEEWREQG